MLHKEFNAASTFPMMLAAHTVSAATEGHTFDRPRELFAVMFVAS